MNSKHKECPELIANVREVTSEGDGMTIGDRVTGIQVRVEGKDMPAVAQIDVRDFRKRSSLVVEIELSELMAALSLATLNAEKDKDAQLRSARQTSTHPTMPNQDKSDTPDTDKIWMQHQNDPHNEDFCPWKLASKLERELRGLVTKDTERLDKLERLVWSDHVWNGIAIIPTYAYQEKSARAAVRAGTPIGKEHRRVFIQDAGCQPSTGFLGGQLSRIMPSLRDAIDDLPDEE